MNKPLTDIDTKSLKQILGSSHVIDDLSPRELFSQDIWAVGRTADFIVRPENTEQLSQSMRIAARSKVRLNPRGAGMSYTKGYIPSNDKTGTPTDLLTLARSD